MRSFSNYLFALIALLLIASCSTSNKALNNGDKWIPAEFDPNTTTLLVQAWDGLGKAKGLSEQKKLMAEKYPYKYEVVSLANIKNRSGQYADTKKYRWALQSTVTYNRIATEGGKSSQTVANRDFNFYDRLNDKSYNSTGRSKGSFKRTLTVVLNTIVKHFSK